MLAGVLTVLLVPMSIVMALIGDACQPDTCDFGVMEFAGWFGLFGIPVFFMISLTLTFAVRRRGRATWWTGLVAVAAVIGAFLLGAVIGAFLLGAVILYAGANRPLFG
ncbi:hypothetical protein [Lacisediminihabitans changchengi]|uniref:Transmembrane protein n=1 Tax=Lacisediminihabitans changchengi TaxID=2787634 RepID=A0A934SIL0_9MICO|nr:hypothetical protein [Lacisediminihabitans changchengi]MBK4347332.1 hypothetical protein [Lacisediminihabitans changchengi]